MEDTGQSSFQKIITHLKNNKLAALIYTSVITALCWNASSQIYGCGNNEATKVKALFTVPASVDSLRWQVQWNRQALQDFRKFDSIQALNFQNQIDNLAKGKAKRKHASR